MRFGYDQNKLILQSTYYYYLLRTIFYLWTMTEHIQGVSEMD